MKKIALAVSAALLAGSAAAANVTAYGVIDTGLAYLNQRVTTDGVLKEKTRKVSMDSSQSTTTFWGLKGTEDLGNGYEVGFVLTSTFSSDTGRNNGDDRLFDREATISLSGDFGSVYAGRMAAMITDVGSVGWYGAIASPFGTGWNWIEGHAAVMSVVAETDNTIAYMSPRFNGLQFSAQYSMGDGSSNENKPANDRYAAIGLDYQLGNFEIGALIDYQNKASANIADTSKLADAWTYNVAANYDCGYAKSFIAFQYFKDVAVMHWHALGDRALDDADNEKTDPLKSRKGFGVNIGVDIPALGGDFLVSAGYADGDLRYAKQKSGDFKIYSALIGYDYPISKRTDFYIGAGMTYEKEELNSGSATKNKYCQAMIGIAHKF